MAEAPAIVGVETMKFSEYTHSLFVPTSLNLIRVKPLRGTALCIFEPRLVFTVVDNFFGGDGRLPTKIEGREFTPTEMRVIQLLLRQVFADLQEAWSPVLGLDFEYINSEVNPHFANIVSPSEIVGKSMGRPPAATTPRFTASISSGKCRWQLLKPEAECAMPTTGRASISFEYPIDFANDRRRYSEKSASP